MSSSKVTITLPTELLERADEVRRRRHYSRSELFREALQLHLPPMYTPSANEIREIEVGLAEIEHGDYVELSSAPDMGALDDPAR